MPATTASTSPSETAGVTLIGAQEVGATVTLCIYLDGDDTCNNGQTRTTTSNTPTTWRYLLTDADFNFAGFTTPAEGTLNLLATETPSGGTPTTETIMIPVDTVVPATPTVDDPPVDTIGDGAGDDNIIVGDNANGICSRIPATEGNTSNRGNTRKNTLRCRWCGR